MQSKKYNIWLPLLVSISMATGIFIGFRMRDNFPGTPFFSNSKNSSVNEVLTLIGRKYVDDVTLNTLNDTAIQVILQKLDPHCTYIPASELDEVNDEIKGVFSGIGIEFDQINDTMEIISLLEKGPALKAGLQIGDKIIKVDSQLVSGVKMSSEQIRKIIRGKNGTSIKLSLMRQNQTLMIQVNREQIPVSSIDASYMIQANTGYIRISKFTSNTHREFMLALTSLKKKGLNHLILDLRDNGGGLMDEAVEIADEFLSGDKLVTYTEGRHSSRKEYRCKRPGEFENGKLTILSNEYSASASEILMGALQDWDRARIVGRRSFGKGLVQEQFDLSNNSAIRLTVARYYTPTGRCIQRPYDGNEENYYQAPFADDAVQDSLSRNARVYTTPGGKKVYGGGGIRPDIIVQDSIEQQYEYFTKEIDETSITRFSHQLILKNQSNIHSTINVKLLYDKFPMTSAMWNDFLQVCFKEIKPPYYDDQLKNYIHKKIIENIAYQIWRSQGYFEVVNTQDPVVQKALE